MSTCLFSHKHQNLNGHVGTVAKHEKHLRAIRLVQNQTTTAVSLLGVRRQLRFRPGAHHSRKPEFRGCRPHVTGCSTVRCQVFSVPMVSI
jgi:hypothetical protein